MKYSKSNLCRSKGHQCYFFYFIFVILSSSDPQRSSPKLRKSSLIFGGPRVSLCVSGLTADHYFWCPRVFLAVLRVFQGIMGCSGVLWDVPGVFRGCSGLYQAVPGVFRGCSGGVPGVFRGVPGLFLVLQTPATVITKSPFDTSSSLLLKTNLRADVAKNQTFSKYCGNSSKINSAHILMLGRP